MATPLHPLPCRCGACQVRRTTPALLLIGVGGLLLAHMLAPHFNTVALVSSFLILWGGLGLAQRLAPRAPEHGAPASLFFPLLLLVIGGLALARHQLPQVPIGAWIADYWPVLLIVWGVIRLLEHYMRPRPARSGLSGGEIALLVMIIFFGLVYSGAYRFGHSSMARYWGVNMNAWNPFLQSYGFQGSARAVLPAGQPVVIRGNRGDVELMAGPPGAVAANLSDQVRAESYDQARQRFQSGQPLIREEGGQTVILPTGGAESGGISADLKLTLPPATPVSFELEDGSVTVHSWGAGLSLRTTHGSITASDIHGDVSVNAAHGNVDLDQIQGAVRINGGGDDVHLTAVTGPVTVAGEFVGSLEFRNLAQGVKFNSSRTGLSVAALPGSLRYETDRIELENAQGVELRTRDEEIALTDCTGAVTLATTNDPISVRLSAPPAAAITATDRNADISLHLPAASQFQLAASAANGEVHNDFAPAPGAPVTLRLETTNGTIAIRKNGGGE